MKKAKVRRVASNNTKIDNPAEGPRQGAFSRVFNSKQEKVNAKKEVSALLTHFAEEDLKRIAATIQKWLAKDAKEQNIRDKQVIGRRARKKY